MEDEYSEIPQKKVFAFSGKRFLFFVFLSVWFLIGSGYFPSTYLSTSEFGDRNILFKIVYIYIAGNVLRSKYYTGWCLSHTAMAFSGLTYKRGKAKTGEIEESFLKAENFDYYGVEIEPNPKKKITVRFDLIFRNGT